MMTLLCEDQTGGWRRSSEGLPGRGGQLKLGLSQSEMKLGFSRGSAPGTLKGHRCWSAPRLRGAISTLFPHLKLLLQRLSSPGECGQAQQVPG